MEKHQNTMNNEVVSKFEFYDLTQRFLDDGKLYDEEDDGALSRIALKKRSEQLIEMRTKKRVTADKGKKGR
ncbi:hypothetical protein ACTXT7_001007 [Hymenolepis weldensis]